jgi:hypothetical protein
LDPLPDKSNNIFDTPDPELSHSAYYDNGALEMKHKDQCSFCFPPESDNYDNRIPRLDPEGTIWWLSRRWDKNSKIIYYSKSPECTVEPDEENASCLALCPLLMPTRDEVNVCRLADKPNYFNDTCLANTIDCPNCDRLRGSIDASPLKGGVIPDVPAGLWENHPEWGVQKIPVSSLYIGYKAFYDK